MAKRKVKEISLADLLKEKYINLNLKAVDKKNILLELAEVVAKSSKLRDKKAFLKAVLERERLGSTGIGNSVAIPHAKLDEVKDFILVFGRKEEGVDFGALDGENTFLFFVLASPKDEVGGHLKIMAKISHLVKDKFVVESLMKAKNEKEILKIVSVNEK